MSTLGWRPSRKIHKSSEKRSNDQATFSCFLITAMRSTKCFFYFLLLFLVFRYANWSFLLSICFDSFHFSSTTIYCDFQKQTNKSYEQTRRWKECGLIWFVAGVPRNSDRWSLQAVTRCENKHTLWRVVGIAAMNLRVKTITATVFSQASPTKPLSWRKNVYRSLQTLRWNVMQLERVQ